MFIVDIRESGEQTISLYTGVLDTGGDSLVNYKYHEYVASAAGDGVGLWKKIDDGLPRHDMDGDDGPPLTQEQVDRFKIVGSK